MYRISGRCKMYPVCALSNTVWMEACPIHSIRVLRTGRDTFCNSPVTPRLQSYSIDSGLNRDFTCSTSSFVAFEAGT